jgi:methylated-DNA-[protein]-cysteine S-methyltransferase
MQKKKQILKYAIFKIEPGWFGVCAVKKGISLLVLPRPTKEEVMELIKKHAGESQLEESLQNFENLKKDIADYFAGNKVEFDYTIDLSHYTPFQSAIFTATRSIPYGKTCSYRWVAKKAGNSKGYRAAGQALKSNSIPLLIPCHRVIEHNGKIGGFSLGIRWKERLLQLEGVLLI